MHPSHPLTQFAGQSESATGASDGPMPSLLPQVARPKGTPVHASIHSHAASSAE